jgi:hypothetical protein
VGLREIFGFAPKEHLVEVHDIRPLPAGEGEPFESCYAAICSCGWVDAPLESEAEARSSAADHAPQVAAGLKRPVG